MIKITDGNAFILRVQGITRNGDYEAEVDLSQIDSMTANFVRRGRSTQESSFDSSGRLLISNEGTLDKGVYGVEMVGYYNGQPWRSYAKNVFEIVNANADADEADATMNDVPIYDVTIAVTLGGSGVTADFVDAMIAKHSDDETSHPYLIEKIEEAGKVDDVLVNGVSVVDGDKVADIPVPTTVAEMEDASDYATKNYVDEQMESAGQVDDVKVNGQSVVANKEADIHVPTTVAELEDAADYATNEGVEEALAAKQEAITEASVEYTEDGGSPDANVEFEDGVMTIQMKNMKMKFSELTAADKEELKGEKGDQGDSAVYDPSSPDTPDFVMANATGQSTTKAMTQKAVTDELDGIKNKVRRGVGDFEITDDEGYPIVRFAKGHIKTKNFDSSEQFIPSESTRRDDGSLDISDKNGYVVMRLEGGHIKSKYFDSSKHAENDNKQYWKDKTLSILGDSISTFGTPDQNNADGIWTYPGNRCRYPMSSWNVTMNDMYWFKLLNRLDMTLGINESWAGSRISNTQATDSGDLGPNRCMASLTRIGHLGENGTPDLIIVYGGTNDAGNGVTVGTFNTENPTNYTEEQIAVLPVATFADAYRTMLIRLQYYYPNARIICLFPNYAPSYYSITNLDKYGEIIREACDFFGVDYLDLRTCGVNIYNKASYLVDGIHPNRAGMNLIYKKLINFIMYK